MLISSPLSPSQKECETNPCREQKNVAVFANRIGLKKSHNHFTHRSHRREHNKCTSRKKKIEKSFVRRCENNPKHFGKLKSGLTTLRGAQCSKAALRYCTATAHFTPTRPSRSNDIKDMYENRSSKG